MVASKSYVQLGLSILSTLAVSLVAPILAWSPGVTGAAMATGLIFTFYSRRRLHHTQTDPISLALLLLAVPALLLSKPLLAITSFTLAGVLKTKNSGF